MEPRAARASNAAFARFHRLSPLPVERRRAEEVPYDAFVREYAARNRPLVVENAIEGWPAATKWTPEFFKTNFGTRLVNVTYEKQMTFGDFIDAVLASTEENPGPYMYRLFIQQHFPELLSDLTPGNPYSFPRRLTSPLMPPSWRRPDGYLKLLIGGVGGGFPVLHYDLEYMHAAITEIYGDKEFVLYPPEDSPYLYPKAEHPNQSQVEDLRNPDLDRFPLFDRARPHVTVLRPGEMVFVPARWWHTARVVTTSISVCQNMMDRTNWRGFVSEVSDPRTGGRFVRRALKRAYLNGLGHVLSGVERVLSSGAPVPPAVRSQLRRIAPTSSADLGAPSDWKIKWRLK